ncbi:ubiquinone biosynthesis accessory factor UbiJ [Derxia lacustris]|uniref:ubiquinone biosynthesis accessory factor UbiJ n=1 Tax=Derxia lacustris TaxID=764842 RepID=UPI000A172E50|nr:SCP2 sterol-binding domain-containing protein [Derxia lacustris]
MTATLASPDTAVPLVAPSALGRVALGGLTAALNHLIASEQWARDRLRNHAGKTAHIAAAPLDLTLVVMSDGLVGAAASVTEPDVRLTLDWAGLPASARSAADGTPLEDALLRHVHIEGEADFANTLGLLLRHVRWDAEDDLARVIGDAAAYRLMSSGRKAGATLRDGARRVAANLAEYLTEERPVLVPRARLDALRADLAALQADADRLGARLAALPARKPG